MPNIDEDDVEPSARQRSYDAASDAEAPAGDQRNLALESLTHDSLAFNGSRACVSRSHGLRKGRKPRRWRTSSHRMAATPPSALANQSLVRIPLGRGLRCRDLVQIPVRVADDVVLTLGGVPLILAWVRGFVTGAPRHGRWSRWSPAFISGVGRRPDRGHGPRPAHRLPEPRALPQNGAPRALTGGPFSWSYPCQSGAIWVA